jgi:hypothetical protein
MTTESTKQGDKRIGRPPEPVPLDKADAIIDWISTGQTLRQWCRDNGIHYSTVYLWMAKDEAFAQRFAQARDIGHDCIADEILEIIDTEPEMAETFSQNGGSKHRDSGHITWLKNRAEQRLKLLAKWNPKKYGDKVDVTSKGEAVGLVINIDKGPQP